jgi:photosystem II stability/assembly factor-like uncharacterized protein
MNTSTVLPEDHVYQFAASKEFSGGKFVCFAARLSGLYRSADGGNWQSAFQSLNLSAPLAALAVAISPDFERDPSVFVGLNGGILHSSDGGQHWETAQIPSPPPVINALTISPDYAQDGILFAGTLEDGVLCSSDRGRHWNAWNFGLMDLNTNCLAISPNFTNDETLFVGTQSGIFRSANGGRAWREVSLPVGFEAVLSLALSPDFVRDRTLFAGTENQGLLRSIDGGQTWKRLGRSRLKEPINAISRAPDFSVRPGILVLHGGALLVSTDGGKTWKLWRDDLLVGKDITAILAPQGFGINAAAFIGVADGTILHI